jgi:hypothetical protein
LFDKIFESQNCATIVIAPIHHNLKLIQKHLMKHGVFTQKTKEENQYFQSKKLFENTFRNEIENQ